VGKPLSFEKEISRKRVVEEIEGIEAEVDGAGHISDGGVRRLRELRIALESKPLIDDEGQ
jgi:hypothetical protein